MLAAGAYRVGRGDHRLDEVVHVHRTGEEALRVAFGLVVVGVHRHVVDLVVGVVEHGVLPLAERGHPRVGTPDGHELDGVVDVAHRLRGLLREATVLVGRLRPQLPRSVELVAEAPELDVEGVLRTVLTAEVGEVGAARVVGVLHQFPCGIDAAGAEVDGLHDLDVRELRPRHELVQTEGIGLEGVPGPVESAGAVLDRAHAVLPVVAGHEVPAGVPHDGGAQFLGQVEHVLAESLVRCRGVAGLEDAGVDAAAHVFDE
ncbi:hypothetical protein [Planctomonas psychrotolerans]|uniref:hypothetical protein n=1 Tax=Planctomonas psychrotolerans TaxID=2528712 RepID=UPI001D0D5DAF|nr:hypothetical protein [Planctomonas psychrotolerans]